MHILDITRILREGMATYPLNPPYAREVVRDVPETTSSLSKITLGTHTGTHVDAPRHVLREGKGINQVPLETLVASAVVLDLTSVPADITATELRRQEIPSGYIVLLKTRNSAADSTVFDESFVACDESAATHLVEAGVCAVGIDGPSIKKYRVQDRTHHLFLTRGIPIIEGLDLARVPPGHYTCVCLPLPLAGADGAPARVILLRGDAPASA